MNVTINIDRRLLNIKLVGLARNVFTMSDKVSSELMNIEKKEHEKKEELLVARAIQWMYEDEKGEWIKFDPSTNKVRSICKHASYCLTY